MTYSYVLLVVFSYFICLVMNRLRARKTHGIRYNHRLACTCLRVEVLCGQSSMLLGIGYLCPSDRSPCVMSHLRYKFILVEFGTARGDKIIRIITISICTHGTYCTGLRLSMIFILIFYFGKFHHFGIIV